MSLKEAETLGQKLAQDRDYKITTNQIRKLLSAINRIGNRLKAENTKTISLDLLAEIQLMRVRLAYQVGKSDRGNRAGLEEIYQKLDPFFKKIEMEKTAQHFKNLADYVETMVAFHKFYGGN